MAKSGKQRIDANGEVVGKRKPTMEGEVTGPQRARAYVASLPDGRAKVQRETTTTYDGYRRMRRQPTIALARTLGIAPVVAAEWQVEADDDVPDDRVEFITKQLIPSREPLIQTILECGTDYGWAPFEKVFGLLPWEGRQLIGVKRFKPLLVDITDITVYAESGQFSGFLQRDKSGVRDIEVPLEQSLLVNFRVEGANLHGEPLLENIRNSYNQWMDSNDGACRYDQKIAGALWVVWYPPGRYTDENGVEQQNSDLAADILHRLESSGSIIIPDMVQGQITELNANGGAGSWRIDLKEAQPKQYSFTNRLEYLDKLLVRGLLSPERLMTEGKFGDRASAEAHAELALTQRELEHRHVVRMLNWHVVDQLLALNYGEDARGTVRLVASPLADSKLTTFGMIFTAMLSDPLVASDVMARIDLDALMDALAIPKVEEVVQAVGSADDEPEPPALPSRIVANRLRELYQHAGHGKGGGNGRLLV